tara:strand:- start:61 stop:1962 length:1902 start_codon:yes stop_codon:yes gene_type:complete
MEKSGKLLNKRILLIDPDEKTENDKTFCFWAEQSNDIYQDYKSIISNEWEMIQINDFTPQKIEPLKYFHINSIDLYELSREIIRKNNIDHVKESVLGIYSEDKLFVESENNIYSSLWIFDGRPPNFQKIINNDFAISQSFFGFKVELKNNEFNENVYHMMDFRVNQNISTQFIYILPYNRNSALIELTRFGKEILNESDAEKLLNDFILNHYGPYELLSKEKGVIPMSTILPKNKSGKRWVAIGTRAGNVKPSTGYAFKNMYNQAKSICSSKDLIAKEVKPNRRFLFYDQLLLIILTLWPHKGKPIFERLFNTKSSTFVLNFLDEKTSLSQDLGMFSSLQIGVFLKAFCFWLYLRLKSLFVPILMVSYTLYELLNNSSNEVSLSSLHLGLLLIGLLILGIPHGALDHLTGFISKKKKITLKFIITYLMLMIPIFFLWIWTPILGLLLFLVYSAWHFGQTDIEHWNISSKTIGFAWGLILLTFLLLTHLKELNIILNALKVPLMPSFGGDNLIAYSLLSVSAILSILYRKLEWFLIVVFLFLSQFINLIFAFGLYFIFHHSRLGWSHLKKSLGFSNLRMYLVALPFNIGAIILFLLFFFEFNLSINQNIAYFFIFLSCVSFPHVISMSIFYKNR